MFLNPEGQAQYIKTLTQSLNNHLQGKNIWLQLVLSTDSVFLPMDILTDNILSLEYKGDIFVENTKKVVFGAPIHDILQKTFLTNKFSGVFKDSLTQIMAGSMMGDVAEKIIRQTKDTLYSQPIIQSNEIISKYFKKMQIFLCFS